MHLGAVCTVIRTSSLRRRHRIFAIEMRLEQAVEPRERPMAPSLSLNVQVHVAEEGLWMKGLGMPNRFQRTWWRGHGRQCKAEPVL